MMPPVSLITRVICVVLVMFTFALTLFSQAQAPKDLGSDSMSEMPEVLVAPLFIETAAFTSTITMVNELSFGVTAQVVLFDRNGGQITSQTVALPAHSREAVLVGDLLRAANSGETMGSVEVLPDPATVVTMAIAAQLSITGFGANAGQQIEEEFLTVGMPGSGVLRSAGASLVGTPVIALKNTAAAAQTATIACITEKGAATGQRVQLRAGGSALLRACTSSSNASVSPLDDTLTPPARAAAAPGAFGVSVAGSGQPGSLVAFGFSWRGAASGAMLSSQNFVDAGTFRSGNTVFTGVPVGAASHLPGALFTPRVAVANFGAKPVNAKVLFARTSDAGGPEVSNVATVTVPADSAQTIALPSLTGDPGLRNSFIVQSDAAPGTLLASVAAEGAPGFGLVEQIGKDELTMANGGGHPWDLTGGRDAVLLLFNHSPVAKYFNVKIGNGRVLWQQPYELAPMETRAISIRDLIVGRVKDQDGVVLPQTLEEGEIGWFNANPAEGKGRLMQIDPASRTVAGNRRAARNFSCSYTYVLCGASLGTSSLTVGVGASSSPRYLGPVIPAICLSANPFGCSGQSSSYNGLGYTYSWSTSNGDAMVYGSSQSATATFWGYSVGSCTAVGVISSGNCNEPAAGTVNVAQLICSPSTVNWAGTVTCTVSGASASQISSWNFSASGVAVNGPVGVTTWSGQMVIGGTVTAVVSGASLTANVTVNSRSTFPAVTMPSPQLVANGSTWNGTTLPTLTSPPTTAEGTFGTSAFAAKWSDTTAAPQNGPNAGLYYIASLSDSSLYVWELNPGLTNNNDPFYQHQGPQGGSCWATIPGITSAVQAHEIGATSSHYSEVKAALTSENPGVIANSIVGSSQQVLDGVRAAYTNAINAGKAEPPTNLPTNINYYPYATCP